MASTEDGKYFQQERNPNLKKKISQIAKEIAASKNLTVFTGAGISTESGLPDYRGPQGVWTLRDQGKTAKGPGKSWSQVEPNLGHYALRELQDMGILKFLISPPEQRRYKL